MIQVEQHSPVVAIRMARSFLAKPIAWSTAYWIDGLLIDTGPACAARDLLRVLDPVPVTQIALTHAHEDTMGGLAALQATYPHARIYASAYALETLRRPERLRLQWYRRLAWGLPQGVRGVISLDEVDNTLTTQDYGFRVVETPGHTSDHISYYEPHQRWVFCGDAYTVGRVRTWPRDADLFGVVSSLRTLADLRPERLFPSSASVRRTPLPDLHAQIGAFIRLARDVAKLEAAGMSSEEMALRLFRGEPRSPRWTEGHLTVANLIEALRSYNALVEPYTEAPDWANPPLSGPPLSRTQSPEDSASSSDSSRAY
jgi:glyoxylase-like metal-dependent hydrolase (beta-lactamase superfamily II)